MTVKKKSWGFVAVLGDGVDVRVCFKVCCLSSVSKVLMLILVGGPGVFDALCLYAITDLM